MKAQTKILFVVGIIILMSLHWYLFPSKEGFTDDTSEYDILRNRLQKDLGPYCKIASFVRSKVEEMQKGFGGSSSDISQMYSGVYACTDQLASSRPSCSSPNPRMMFVPCSVYMNLPDWSDSITVTSALRKITDDLPERLQREIEWFSSVIQKLREGLAAGANPAAGSNPVGVPPSLEQLNAFKEGFTCSPEASEYLRQKALADEAASCSPLTPASEIDRVNNLLNNPSVKAAVSLCNTLMSEMIKLQSDLEKLKNGTLYDWQQGGPAKSYEKFKGGDRTASFLFSIKQNQ